MTTVLDLVTYLREQGVEFRVTAHLPAYSTRALAAANHLAIGEVVHAEVYKVGGLYWMAIVPGDAIADREKLRAALHAAEIDPVDQNELEAKVPGCEAGAIPPLGNLFGMRVIADMSLAHLDRIVFHACSHTESMMMEWADFIRLVKPLVASIAERSRIPASGWSRKRAGEEVTSFVQFRCRGCGSIFWATLPRGQDGRALPLTCSSCGTSDLEWVGPLAHDAAEEDIGKRHHISVL
jgi:Ala-tRNA(Pro) deacylase